MREIKFRGWDEKNKEMVYNIKLLFSNHLNGCFEEYEECGLKIMQYTGLKDKNGKKIFEGDIDRCGYTVTYIDGQDSNNLGMNVGFYTQRDDFESWAQMEVGEEYEIIGNIHEGVQE